MTLCIAGKNQIAVDVLDAVVQRYGRQALVAVANRTDDGCDGWQPSFRRHATAVGVALHALDDLYAIPDLTLLSLEFDRIVRPARFARPEALYNLHFSLLPRYRGMYTAVWPVLHGDAEAGVTLHAIDAGIDTGDIVAQRAFPLTPALTARDVYLACLAAGRDLLVAHLDGLVGGTLARTPQGAAHASYFAKASLDFARLEAPQGATAWQLQRFVHAFAFREYQLAQVAGFASARAVITETRSTRPSGEVVARGADWLVVATMDFDVRLESA